MEKIKEIFDAGAEFGFSKRAGLPTIGLSFDEQCSNFTLPTIDSLFIVHILEKPLSYHKTEIGAKNRVEEWHKSCIVDAKKVSYFKINIEY